MVVTPAHQHPTGAVLSGERRAALLAWLREHDAVAIEDDYDAEYRYDRAAVGALQGLEPDRVVYAGSASKTLAPALRLGWLVVPPRLLEAVRAEKLLADLRHGPDRPAGVRATSSSAASSTATCAACAPATAPAATRSSRRSRPSCRTPRSRGIAAGLHVTVELPPASTSARSGRRPPAAGSRFNTMLDYRPDRRRAPPSLMLGYGAARRAGDPRRRPRARQRGTSSKDARMRQRPRLSRSLGLVFNRKAHAAIAAAPTQSPEPGARR